MFPVSVIAFQYHYIRRPCALQQNCPLTHTLYRITILLVRVREFVGNVQRSDALLAELLRVRVRIPLIAGGADVGVGTGSAPELGLSHSCTHAKANNPISLYISVSAE